MGALKGSISYTLYYVEGTLEPGFVDAFMERIEEFRFRELTPESEDDMTFGWCRIDDMLRADIDRTGAFRGGYLTLGMRVDRWSLPGALLKARIAERQQQVMTEFSKAKLSRMEKERVRETVTREMKGQTLPSASMVDMVWQLDEGRVRFWSQSNTRREQFEELFESTFGMRLQPSGPYIAAVNCGLTDEATGRLADVEQAAFTNFG